MQCPRCQASNRPTRRFCAKCGTSLTVACAACGTANEPGAAFCGGCGAALAGPVPAAGDPRAAPEPERRQLTVMFCDLADFTALSQEIDPEDLRRVIRAYHERATAVIDRWAGFVARYMGDGVLAYFGYPRAHEDDAARAIHAGLDLLDALRDVAVPGGGADRRLAVRVGVATGLVVVGDMVGAGASEETVAMGETPNLAARIQAIAARDSIVVASTTRELAGGLFEFADLGAHELKGFRQPLRLWRVLGASGAESRFDAARGAGLTPLVGREEEMRFLLQRWERARAGAGQAVLICGEAGLGKSRIAEALGERIGGAAQVLRFQCSPHRSNSALYPFIAELERAADIRRTDAPHEKLDKLQASLARAAPLHPEAVPLLATLLSVPLEGGHAGPELSPQQRKERTLETLAERLAGLAGRTPMLLLFEDAHWIDPTSAEFLDLFAHRLAELPLLAIVTSREAPDASPLGAWLKWPHAAVLRLERLERKDAVAMAETVCERERVPAALVERIVMRADGVPLFIEELAKVLAATGATARSEIPATLQDLLMARLDRLGPAKEVAQIGAVIGREFGPDLVASACTLSAAGLRDALDALVASGVVRTSRRAPGGSYTFSHALIQDAAYESLLRSRRQELHGAIAATLETSYPERLRTEPEVVAHHYTQAGEALRAAGYCAMAAARALDRSANREVLGHATAGLRLLADLPSAPDRDRLDLTLEILRGTAYRAVSGFASSDAERSFARALELSERSGELERRIDARRGLFSCYYARGALGLAGDQAAAVATLGRQAGDTGSRMLGHWMSGCVELWRGDFPAARRELEEAWSLYDPGEARANTLALQIDPGVNALLHLGWVLWSLGYPEQGLRRSEQAIATARELAQPFALAMALILACATRISCRQHAAAAEQINELTAITAEHGLGYLGSVARVLDGQRLIERGETLAGIGLIGRAFGEFEAQEAGVGIPWAMHFLAHGYLRLGKADECVRTVAMAFTRAEHNGERHWDAELWRLKGEAMLLPDRRDEAAAETCFRAGMEVARGQSALSLELRAATSLAALLAARGEAAAARALLEERYGRFTEGFDTGDLRDARALLQRLRERA